LELLSVADHSMEETTLMFSKTVRLLMNVGMLLRKGDNEKVSLLSGAVHVQIDEMLQEFISYVSESRKEILSEIISTSQEMSEDTTCFFESISGFRMMHSMLEHAEEARGEVYEEFSKKFVSVISIALKISEKDSLAVVTRLKNDLEERAKWKNNPEGHWQHLWYLANTTTPSELDREDLRDSIYRLLIEWSGVRHEHMIQELPDVVRPKAATALRDLMLKLEPVFDNEYLFADKAFVRILHEQAASFKAKFTKADLGAVPLEQEKREGEA